MRLGFTSDLHVDHHPELGARIAARAREQALDALLIAGDVSPRLESLEEALRALADAAPCVAFVAGNHDLWCADARARYLEEIPAVCARAGVRCLHEGPVELPGATLVGQTGWYDYSMRDPAHEEAIPLDAYRRGRWGRLEWTDTRFVRWPGLEDDLAITAWMAERLAGDLARARRDRPIVVVTHMLPFDELAPRRPLPWGFVRGFLGAVSLGEAIIAAAAAGAPVARVVSGHTHFRRTAVVRAGGREIVAETSPIGYPREYRRLGLDHLGEVVAERLQVATC